MLIKVQLYFRMPLTIFKSFIYHLCAGCLDDEYCKNQNPDKPVCHISGTRKCTKKCLNDVQCQDKTFCDKISKFCIKGENMKFPFKVSCD